MAALLPWPIENDTRPMIAWRTMALICRVSNILLLRYIIIWCVLCGNGFCICVSGRSGQGVRTVWHTDGWSVDISRLSGHVCHHWRPRGGPGVGPDCPTERVGLSTLELDRPRLDADDPVISRFANLSSRDGDSGICSRYEFIGIPYNG
jgi:hypothetical protein